jgi:hypothetical protein
MVGFDFLSVCGAICVCVLERRACFQSQRFEPKGKLLGGVDICRYGSNQVS